MRALVRMLAGCVAGVAAVGMGAGIGAVPPQSSAPLADARGTLVATYRTHLEFLANPFMEGRGPGTRGNAIAADYLEHAFTNLGLGGAFDPHAGTPDAPNARQAAPLTMRQPFNAGTRAELTSASVDGVNPAQPDGFVVGRDFTVLGFSASGRVAAPLAFAGYSIEKGGPDGSYSSFPSDAGGKPLEGRIAIVLRFEPMDESGKSLWKKTEDTGWSAAAALADKFQAAAKRGAAGIILVSPPGTDDPRATRLESTEASARWMRTMDIPVIMATAETADALVRQTDPQRRTLADLCAAANTGGAVVTLGDQSVTIAAEIDRSPRATWNIAATLPGRGTLATQYVVIGAHYDHVGYGYTGGSRSDEYGIVHPGADDNASGTAGLLLAAEVMKRSYEAAPPGSNLRSVMFIAFSAEEMGLIGSREFMKACPIEAKNIDCMLNMDMIGRVRDGKVDVSGTGTAEGFADLLKPVFDASGLTVQTSPGGRGPSDHATFYGAGVPVLHFFSGMHDQYHTPRDTVDLINFEGGVNVARLVCDVASMLAARETPLVFLSTDRKKADDEPGKPQITLGGVRVRFGIAPGNYSDGEAGILVGEVYPGTCAAEAGIQTGDRLIRWNGREIGDVQGWMEIMSGHKPGDVVDVDVKRGKEELRVKATLKSRDQAPK